jgi:glutamyl-tRNA synthetase
LLRFATSPTGDMHIGNLRVALFNYILSKQLNEELFIRIDDTNKEKNIEGKDKEILEILHLFSIDYTRVIYQSENIKYHQRMAMQLLTHKKAFSCFCSDEKLEELKEKAKNNNQPYHYDGFCATLSDEAVLNVNAPFTVRIKMPEETINFKDLLKGEVEYEPFNVDSFIILKHDKTPTSNYASAVDDMLYNISSVIQDEEHLSNVPKQIHIRKSLGYNKEINYTHLPIISNENEHSVKWLISEGFLPAAIANYLVLIGNNTPIEIFTLEDAISWFSFDNLSKSPTKFDMDKLRLINKKHLENLDDMRLSKLLGFADESIGKLGKLFLEENSTIKEIKSKIDLIFSKKETLKGFEDEVKLVQKCVQTAPFFEEFEELKTHLIQTTNLKEDSLLKPLKYVLTGEIHGPILSDMYSFIKNYIGEIVK